MTQFALDMRLPIDYSAAGFMCSASNKLAYEWINRFPDWPIHALYLYGEVGSGKTHLAHMWQQKTDANFLSVDDEVLPNAATIVDDVQNWNNADALFHLYNHCKQEKIPLLFTANVAPDDLPFSLPDLLSRFKALPIIRIEEPDDALITAIFSKHLSDRQLKVTQEVLDYMLPRLPRSCAAIAALMQELDSQALAHSREMTIPFIRKVCGW